jgi:hypothetical protein
MQITEETRAEIYRYDDARVDLKMRPGEWFARIRVWDGGRWPRVRRTWHARLKPWIPWFSLERQVVRAVEYANRCASVYVPRKEIRKRVRGALQSL